MNKNIPIISKKGILRSGNDQDAIKANKILCCLSNIPFLRKFVKRRLMKHMRQQGKKYIKNELEE